MELNKVIVLGFIVLILFLLVGCISQPEFPEDKITSKEEANEALTDISKDIKGIEGTLGEIDDDLG